MQAAKRKGDRRQRIKNYTQYIRWIDDHLGCTFLGKHVFEVSFLGSAKRPRMPPGPYFV